MADARREAHRSHRKREERGRLDNPVVFHWATPIEHGFGTDKPLCIRAGGVRKNANHQAFPGLRASGFVLIVQHRWLIVPDTVNESSANDEELGRGVRQGRDARDCRPYTEAMFG